MARDEEYRCRVCGWKLAEPPWGPDGATPTYDYCPCCSVEFGYGDATPVGARRHREQWLNRGAAWDEPSQRPDDWDLDAQLAKVPAAFR